MEDNKLKEIINKALDVEQLDYEPVDRTKANEAIIARFSKQKRKKRKFFYAAVSVCASAVLIVLVSVIIVLSLLSSKPVSDKYAETAVTNVREQYPDLLHPPDEFELVKGVLYKKAGQDKYLVCEYKSSDFGLSYIAAINGYVYENEQLFTSICLNETEKQDYVIYYGELNGAAYAVFELSGNKYLLTLYSASAEQILTVLEMFA